MFYLLINRQLRMGDGNDFRSGAVRSRSAAAI
jgi:hypothetical protein